MIEIYPDAEIKCTRLDQENKGALCFACGILLTEKRAQEASVLPRGRFASCSAHQQERDKHTMLE